LPWANNGIVEPCEVYEHPYVFLGWAVKPALFQAIADFEVFEASLLARFNLIATAADPEASVEAVDEDWEFQLSGSGGALVSFGLAYRLREGIERFFITDINNPAASADAQSSIPIMWDEISGHEALHFNHVPGGCNVPYLDGHVEFVGYQADGLGEFNQGNEFPVNGGGMMVHHTNHGFE